MKNYLDTPGQYRTTPPKEPKKKLQRICDGKGQFYQELQLDKPTMKIIHWYRRLKYQIDRDIKSKDAS